MRVHLLDRDNPNLPTYQTATGRMRGVYSVDTLFKNITGVVAIGINKAIIKNAKSIFDLSMRMVPVDTGKTAQSGRLMVAGRTVGVGVVDDAENGVTHAVYTFKSAEDVILKASSTPQVNIRIGFRRFDDKTGENIIDKIHELGPLGSRKEKALKQGRSGHFITFPFYQYSKKITYDIQQFVARELGKVTFHGGSGPYVPTSAYTSKGKIKKSTVSAYKAYKHSQRGILTFSIK